MRHEARLNERQSDGRPYRAHLAVAAARGHAPAIEALRGPEIPTGLAYLYGWALELAAVRGAGMAGPLPVTYSEILAWAQLTDRMPTVYEVEALLAIDAAMRHPEETA